MVIQCLAGEPQKARQGLGAKALALEIFSALANSDRDKFLEVLIAWAHDARFCGSCLEISPGLEVLGSRQAEKQQPDGMHAERACATFWAGTS